MYHHIREAKTELTFLIYTVLLPYLGLTKEYHTATLVVAPRLDAEYRLSRKERKKLPLFVLSKKLDITYFQRELPFVEKVRRQLSKL